MSIDDDIRGVLEEVGTPCVIHKPQGVSITGEYIDPTSHTEHTTPMIRSFFVDFTTANPTQMTVGDVIEWSGRKILLLVLEPEMFEGGAVDYLSAGYRVNAHGAFQHFDQDAGFDADYKRNRSWEVLYDNVQGTIMDRLFRSMVMSVSDHTLDMETNKLHFYISSYYSEVKMGMRWVPSDGGPSLTVENIEDHTFPGIRVVFLADDTRQ